MKDFNIIVRPQLCVGCRQCMIRCAEAHSGCLTLAEAIRETPLAKPRIFVGPGPEGKPFPNKCRQCDPAPCEQVCVPGAIRTDIYSGLKIVDYGLCIGCTMCAMTCPYHVIRFFPHWSNPEKFKTAIKCDGCYQRLERGKVPACAEACKTGAIIWDEENRFWERASAEFAGSSYQVKP
ncbi:4Fe-4S dicluster domain-containing protein [Desulfonatronovibrio hydrogenovorans]|uniref:4Fe-4S dicluster domain-containing protein n=1 Tax=Desulfonatronovibrio hydrogenovorans TaxID=53245 RepID=UPI00068AF07C|nr:4Fe-4S dicluster domain-containing protein [Desulfonatronovibrio hydrogenovorans]